MTHRELARYSGCPVSVVDITLPFHDIDVMEIAWHGNYFKYFEIARCSVLRAIEYDYPQMRASGYAWPIIDIRSRFIRPGRYNDPLKVAAVIQEWDIRLLIRYLVYHRETREVIARGKSIQVPVNMATGDMEIGCPPSLIERVERWRKGKQVAG